jgi:hypothetical protein
MDDIQTQKGESESMDLPFLFSQSRIFRALGLTLDSKVRYGCRYPFGICNNQFNFKSLDYLNKSVNIKIPISNNFGERYRK